MDSQWAKESNLPRILGITGTIHGIALICVGLRVYARMRLLRTPGPDDAAIVVASVGSAPTPHQVTVHTNRGQILALGGYICFVLQGKQMQALGCASH